MAQQYVNLDEMAVLAPSPAWGVGEGRVRGEAEISVLHVITGVTMGGAEMMLFRLLARGDRGRFSPTVLSLLGPGAVGQKAFQGGEVRRQFGVSHRRSLRGRPAARPGRSGSGWRRCSG